MDAEQLDFPAAAFDRVLCGFAVWLLPQPHWALQEFFRVPRPGGRVGLTTWTEDCPFLTWCRRELMASLPRPAPLAAGSQEVPRFNTPARLEVALQQAGFVDIHINMEAMDFVYQQDEDWWLSLWPHGIRQRFERLEAPVLAQVKADMLHKGRVLKQADGIHTLFRSCCGDQAWAMTWYVGQGIPTEQVGHTVSSNITLSRLPTLISCSARVDKTAQIYSRIRVDPRRCL